LKLSKGGRKVTFHEIIIIGLTMRYFLKNLKKNIENIIIMCNIKQDKQEINMNSRNLSTLLLIFCLSFSFLNGENVRVIEVQSSINPASARYITNNIKIATEKNDECLVIKLDTPGGLMNSMRTIVKEILNANIPIVVYVSPSGARAASAGVFITASSHIAAMTPGTNIGAAHPVQMGGMPGQKQDSTTSKIMMEKATNDAVAYIRGLANERGRNENWLEKSITESVSIPAQEALEKNVIDYVESDLDSLLTSIHGTTIKFPDKKQTLNTKSASTYSIDMSLHIKILDTISNPNLSYMLMILGILGVFFEIKNPGAIIPGVVGGLSLILAFYSFQILPINYTALALIAGAIILFILEVHITSFGLLTILGGASMILGSMMLINSQQDPAGLFSISLALIIPVVILTAAFVIFVIIMARKAHKSQVSTGQEGITGAVGKAISDIDEKGGKVLVEGEIWRAYSNEPIKEGEEIIVEKSRRMKLIVNKYKE